MRKNNRFYYLKRHKKYVALFFFILLILYIRLVPFVYTPPALTQKILDVYKQVIVLAEDSEADWTLKIRPCVKDAYFVPEGEFAIKVEIDNLEKIQEYIPTLSARQLDRIILDLYGIDCYVVRKKDGFIYFIPYAKILKPCRAGIAYSLSGRNLEIHDIRNYLQRDVYFEIIHPRWFLSKDLVVTGWRLDSQHTIPSSLFDFSKTSKDIDLLRHE